MSSRQALQEMYRTSGEAVRATGFDLPAAAAHYKTFIHFLSCFVPSGAFLCDVGCGSGWSSYLLCDAGYRVLGTDLNYRRFEAPRHQKLDLVSSSVLDLPFADNSFDAIATYVTLEHVPDPGRALSELLRVVRPGGTIIVVGPNLLSPLASIRGLLKYVWANRPLRRILVRDAEMPRHPGGNTLPEIIVNGTRNSLRLLSKSMSSHLSFDMRTPDLKPPFSADNDSCYLCNPVDLIRFFRQNSCEILQSGAVNRPKFLTLFVTGTYIAARKPGSPSK